MGWTKRQLLQDAFDEIGLADYVFDLTSSTFQGALRKMDAFVAVLNAKKVRISYPLPSSPSASSLDEELDIPDDAIQAIVTYTAMRIAPSFGKTVSPDTKAAAAFALDTLFQNSATPLEMQMPGTMPAGAGNKPWRRTNDPFLLRPVERLDKDLDWLVNTSGSIRRES